QISPYLLAAVIAKHLHYRDVLVMNGPVEADQRHDVGQVLNDVAEVSAAAPYRLVLSRELADPAARCCQHRPQPTVRLKGFAAQEDDPAGRRTPVCEREYQCAAKSRPGGRFLASEGGVGGYVRNVLNVAVPEHPTRHPRAGCGGNTPGGCFHWRTVAARG